LNLVDEEHRLSFVLNHGGHHMASDVRLREVAGFEISSGVLLRRQMQHRLPFYSYFWSRMAREWALAMSNWRRSSVFFWD
jgi:hypothetical protein